MARQHLPAAARASLLALLCSACASYGFVRQDVGLRLDQEADALELVVVSHGLLEHASASAQVAADDAAGGRHVILGGWPFEFDLPDMEEKLRSEEHPLAARALALLEGVEVVESGAFGAEGGPFSLYQRLRIARASEAVDLVNEALNSYALAGAQAGYASRFGERSGELFAEHVRAGKPWVALEQGALVVRLPMSPEGAARALQELLRHYEEGMVPLAEALSALALEDGAAVLTFAPGADGWIRLRPRPEHKEGAGVLAPAEGLALRPEPPGWVVGFLTRAAEPPAGGGEGGERR